MSNPMIYWTAYYKAFASHVDDGEHVCFAIHNSHIADLEKIPPWKRTDIENLELSLQQLKANLSLIVSTCL